MAYRATHNGLTLRQDNFAKCLAIGLTEADAYRECFPCKGKSDSAIESAAHRVAVKPKVIERAKTFLKEAKASDLHSPGEWMNRLLDDLQSARDDKNWTAVAALTRLTGQAVGTLNETVTVRAEHSLSDETLVAQLTARDPSLAAKLSVLLSGKRATQQNRGQVLELSAQKAG